MRVGAFQGHAPPASRDRTVPGPTESLPTLDRRSRTITLTAVARPARFTEQDLLRAAAEVAAERGPAGATVAAIAKAAGAPTGSLYHRFASRDLLLGRLWLELIGRFQAGWIEALERGDAAAAALHSVAWVRGNPREARLLLLYRREDFLAGDWPASLAELAAHVNDRAADGLRAYARDR